MFIHERSRVFTVGGYDRVFPVGELWRVFSVWVHGRERVLTVSGREKVFTVGACETFRGTRVNRSVQCGYVAGCSAHQLLSPSSFPVIYTPFVEYSCTRKWA